MFDVGYADLGADDGAGAGVEVLRCFDAHPEDGLVVAHATIFGRCLEMRTLTGGRCCREVLSSSSIICRSNK